MTSPDFFTSDEQATLHAHGIVLFADRVIFEAQPPMTVQEIAAVQAQCAGPIPEPLLARNMARCWPGSGDCHPRGRTGCTRTR